MYQVKNLDDRNLKKRLVIAKTPSTYIQCEKHDLWHWMKKKKYKRSYRKRDPRLNPRFQMEGKEIGNIKVISFSHSSNRRSYWNCKCFCGELTVISRKNMTGKSVKNLSCGCMARKSPGPLRERTEQEKKEHKINCLINLSHQEGSCRIWDGYFHKVIPKATYLNVSYNVRALMWKLHNGDIPKGCQVSNRCQNPKCIELKHLCLELKGSNRWKAKQN